MARALSADNTAPGRKGVVITKSDSTVVNCRAIYVGVSGDIAIHGEDDAAVTFVGVPQGTILPIAAKRILSTGTTASSLVAIF